MKKILVIGLVGESVFLKCDHFHQPNETISCEKMYTEIGGKGFNQALTINTLGGDVEFVSSIGNDYYGQICVDETKKLGLKHIYFKTESNTSFATILTDKSGDNQVSVYRGSTVNKEHLNYIYQCIDNADLILLQFEMNLDVIKEIIRYSKTKQKYVILNPAPAVCMFEEVLMCDLIIPNENEVEVLFGKEYVEKIRNSNLNVVVTLGSKGSMIINKNEVINIPCEKVNVIDTTGAGDVFCGSLTYMLSKDKDLHESVLYASKMASESVKYHCVIPSILHLKKL